MIASGGVDIGMRREQRYIRELGIKDRLRRVGAGLSCCCDRRINANGLQ